MGSAICTCRMTSWLQRLEGWGGILNWNGMWHLKENKNWSFLPYNGRAYIPVALVQRKQKQLITSTSLLTKSLVKKWMRCNYGLRPVTML